MNGASGSPGRGRAAMAIIAAVVALSVAAILWTTRSAPSSSASGPGAAAPGAAPSGEARPQPGFTDAGAASSSGGTALVIPASAQDPAAAGPAAVQGWEAVPLAARLSDLGPLARPVYDGLKQARDAMEPCFQADARDQAAHPRAANAEDPIGAAIVTLQMEGRPGELVVVNAPLQALGTSSMPLVECCERVLRGFRIPAPAATPGKRYRLNHQLTQ